MHFKDMLAHTQWLQHAVDDALASLARCANALEQLQGIMAAHQRSTDHTASNIADISSTIEQLCDVIARKGIDR